MVKIAAHMITIGLFIIAFIVPCYIGWYILSLYAPNTFVPYMIVYTFIYIYIVANIGQYLANKELERLDNNAKERDELFNNVKPVEQMTETEKQEWADKAKAWMEKITKENNKKKNIFTYFW